MHGGNAFHGPAPGMENGPVPCLGCGHSAMEPGGPPSGPATANRGSVYQGLRSFVLYSPEKGSELKEVRGKRYDDGYL